MKIRFAIIGYGWRAAFYYRIAKILPELFQITAGVLRTPERAEEVAEKEHIFATANPDEALAGEPDFAVLCVPRNLTKDYLVSLMDKGIPVLCETPPGKDTGELLQLWTEAQEKRGKIQIAEQYFLQPYYAAVQKLIDAGYLGEISSVTLSALHDYHAFSIYRKLLNIKYENCAIQGQRFESSVTATNGRNGFDTSGTILKEERSLASICFENGKTALYDFESQQYFSLIRSRKWNIRGSRGEINDMTVSFLNSQNLPIEQPLHRLDVGRNNNSEWAHRGISFLDKMLYENPFYPARMNDDEIAVSSCLLAMKEYVESGKEFYPLRDALQDAYLSFLMHDAMESGGRIRSETQPWARDT